MAKQMSLQKQFSQDLLYIYLCLQIKVKMMDKYKSLAMYCIQDETWKKLQYKVLAAPENTSLDVP